VIRCDDIKTDKEEEEEDISFVALLLLFKNREKELYPKTNDIQNTRRVLSRGLPLQKKREREKQNEEMDVSCTFHKSFSCEKRKKNPLSREEKTQQTTSEKKKNDKTNRRLLLLCKTETLYTHFGGFIHSQEKQYSCSLFFFVREEIRGVFSRRRF
jgi:hypothetical protein